MKNAFGHVSVWGMLLSLFLSLTLAIHPRSARAEVSVPQTDRTPLAPLATSPALPFSLDYVSGVGLGAPNSYAIFYENKNEPCVTAGNPPYRMYTAQTSTGPLGLGAPTAMDICDSHFIARDWPLTVGSTTYAYRGWGAGNYNGTHYYYGSNDRIHWTVIDTFAFTHPSDGILYNFHDIVRINGQFLGFVESAGGSTYIVQNTHFDADPLTDNNHWTVIDPAVGGITAGAHLRLPGSSGPKPTGNFQLMEVGGQLVYAKLYLPGDSSAAYLIINAAAAQAPTPAAAAAAFIDVDNWTWSTGAAGAAPAASQVLTATSARNIRTAWIPPMSSPADDYVILYSGQYSSPSRRALGCASSDPLCMLAVSGAGEPDPAADARETTAQQWSIPTTGFPPGVLTEVGTPRTAYDRESSILLEIPKLRLKLGVVGVPQVDGTWSLDWLGGAAGWLEGTAFPGLDGNSVITSHVVSRFGSPGPFARLHGLTTGDYIFLSAFSRRYVYEVRSVANLSAADTSIFNHETTPALTLVTCSRYNEETRTYDARLVVRAALIQVTAAPR